jgi:DNA-binding XRE family transcriptional regulator
VRIYFKKRRGESPASFFVPRLLNTFRKEVDGVVTKLKLARMESGDSQREVAARLNVSPGLLSGIENGKAICPPWLRPKLALSVGRPEAELFDKNGFPKLLRA